MDTFQKYRNFTGSATELAVAVIDCATAFGLDIDTEKTNERLIRYYQTEGVLDRPERYGRDSAYHFRHLIQLLNARRLVTNGLPLALAIQYNSTLSTDELEASLKAPLPTRWPGRVHLVFRWSIVPCCSMACFGTGNHE